MARRPIDPARLTGTALSRWYRRTPADVQRARDEDEAAGWQDFEAETRRQLQTDRPIARAVSLDPDDLYIATGSGGWRRIGSSPLLQSDADAPSFHPASPEEGEFLQVGNPLRARLIAEWEKREGRPWPRDEFNRQYEVGHKKALADGGTNTLDNIEPIHPKEHRALHRNNGDAARWQQRAGIAKAFGGRVEPTPGQISARRALRIPGPLGIFSTVIGALSGASRARTDSYGNFISDVLGVPTFEDLNRLDMERKMQKLDPNWKPGDPYVI